MFCLVLKQCHYSIVLHVFIDFHVNLIAMDVGDTLDYISFFAIQCNGTTALAEIHRVVMADLDTYRDECRESDSMFQFLCNVFKKLWPDTKGVGSCTDNRYTYSGGSCNTNWSEHRQDFLDLCSRFYETAATVKSQATMTTVTASIVKDLLHDKDKDNSKKYKGIGAMGAIQFVHIAACLGLIPMYCYTYAELIDANLGPAMFIKAALLKKQNDLSLPECNKFFKGIVSDLQVIWGHHVTPALIENILCELSRSYKCTLKKMKLGQNDAKPLVDGMLNENLMVDGNKNDICFFDHKRNRIQNFFLISVNDPLRPELIMKKSSNWGETCGRSNMSITNFCENGNDKSHLKWSLDGSS